MFWKLLPQIVATLLMLLIALLDYKWFDRRTRRFRRGRKAVFGLVGLLMVVSIVAIWRDHEADNVEKASLRNEIRDLKGMQSGGDSYCYVSPSLPNKRSATLDLMLLHEGRYPVFDVSVRIEDVNRLVEIIRNAHATGQLPYDSKAKVDAATRSAVVSFTVGNIGPKQGMDLPTLYLSGRDEEAYNIYIMARNGRVFEQLRFRRLSGDWKLAYRLFRGNDLLREYVDPNFPLKNGAGPWE